MDPGTAKSLSVLVVRSYNTFNVYGKPGSAVGDIYRSFETTLAPFPEDKIIRAFDEWMAEKSVMPTPADIVKIVRRYAKHDEDIQKTKTYIRERDEERANWIPPTEAEKAEVKKIVESIIPPKTMPVIDKNQNYAHWNRMTDAEKELCKIRPPVRQ